MALDRPWRHSVAIVFAPAFIYRRLDRDGRSEPKTNTLRTRVCPGNLLPFFFLFFFVFFFNGARPTTVRRDRLTRPDRFHQRPVSIRTDDVVIRMETKKKISFMSGKESSQNIVRLAVGFWMGPFGYL